MGELRLRKRGNKWSYSFEGAKIDGHRKTISKGGFDTKAAAVAAGTKALNEYNTAGDVFVPTNMSVSDYLDLWIEKYCNVNLKVTTVINYKKKIELHIKPVIGHYKLAALKPLALQSLIDAMFNAGYSRNTLAVIKGILSGSLSYAVQPLGYIQHSPAIYLKLPSTRAKPKNKSRAAPHVYLTPEQMSKVFARFPEGSSSYIPLLIGYKCGLRLGEMFGLTWDCIDFVNNTITIDKQVQWREKNKETGEAGYWFVTAPKYNSVRTIEMSSDVAEVLKREKEKQSVAKVLYGNLYAKNYVDEKNGDRLSTTHGSAIDFVTVRLNGSYIISRNMQYVSQVATQELGLKFDYHSLRHTHATILAEKGASVKYVQHRLGHKNVQVTLQYYQHLTEVMSNSDAKFLEDF